MLQTSRQCSFDTLTCFVAKGFVYLGFCLFVFLTEGETELLMRQNVFKINPSL